MTTFKATVQRHQVRRDGKFPVSIRVTQNRQVTYLPTGLYVEKRQINSKTFEIKDQFVLERTNKTIREYEKILLGVSTNDLLSFSTTQIKSLLGHSDNRIDFFAFCDKLIESNPNAYRYVRVSLDIIKNEMGYKAMYATDITSAFMRKFIEHMNTRDMDAHGHSGKMKDSTKQNYLTAFCSAFRKMKETYNTEFHQVITHDPFIGLQMYKKKSEPIVSIDIESLRKFFAIVPKTKLEIVSKDMITMMFCLCGMNSADIIALNKSNYRADTRCLSYCRSKTKNARSDSARTSITIPEEILPLFDKYYCNTGEKLFDFGRQFKDMEKTRCYLNRYVKILCEKNNLPHMNPYQFRHTWATIARNKCEVSKDDIDLCLVHKGINPMADVYIEPDYSRIDRANRKVLDYVFGGEKKGDA